MHGVCLEIKKHPEGWVSLAVDVILFSVFKQRKTPCPSPHTCCMGNSSQTPICKGLEASAFCNQEGTVTCGSARWFPRQGLREPREERQEGKATNPTGWRKPSKQGTALLRRGDHSGGREERSSNPCSEEDTSSWNLPQPLEQG